MLLRIRVCCLTPSVCSLTRLLCTVHQPCGELHYYHLATNILSIIQLYSTISCDQKPFFPPLRRMDARPADVSGARRQPDVNKLNP
jgi:hypothetical protein